MWRRKGGLDAGNLIRGAKDQRGTLVQFFWNNIQNTGSAVGGCGAGAFHQQRDRICLIEQTQPPLVITVAPVGRVEIHPAADQNAIGVGDH